MTDLIVSFGANTADLNAAFAAVKTQVQSFGGTIKTAADQSAIGFTGLTAAVKENTAAVEANRTSWLKIAFGVTAGEAAFAALSGALSLAGKGVRETGNDFLTFGKHLEGIWASEIRGGLALARSVIDNYGSMKRAAEVFLFGEKSVAAAEAARAAAEAAAAERAKESWAHYFASFAVGREKVLAWEAAAKAATEREERLSTALVEGSARALAAAGTMGRFVESLKGSDFEAGTAGLRRFIEKLMEIPDATAEDAVAIQNILGATQDYSAALGTVMNDAVVAIAGSAEEAKTLATAMKAAFSDPAANGTQFIANLGTMGIALKEQFETAKETHNINQMRAALLDAMNAKEQNIAAEEMRRLKEKGDAETEANRKALEAVEKMRSAGESLRIFPDLFGVSAGAAKLGQEMLAAVGPAQQTAAAIKEAADNLERMALQGAAASESLRNLPQTNEQVFAAAKPIIANARPQIDQIEEITNKLKVLYEERQRLQTAGGSPFGALTTPGTARELERNKEAADSLEDSLRKLQDQRKGGSAAELLENTQAQARAKFMLDEAAAARALAAAYEQESAGTKNLAEAKRLHILAVEQLEKADKLEAETAAAGYRRVAAAAEEGSKAQLAATLRANAAKRAVTQPGSAERVALAAADEAAERRHQQKLNADAQAGEDARYKIKQDGLAAADILIQQEAQEYKISLADEKSALLANQAEREAAEREHLAKIKDIYGQGTSQFRAAQKRLEEIAADSALKRAQIERTVDRQIFAQQEQTIDQTASIFSQAIFGVIAGQMRLRDAARLVAGQIISTYIQLAAKMVLENSGAIGKMVAQTVTGEGLKTAAATAGVSARTSAEATGAAATGAGTIAAVLKSIFASAAETFAGIFGFLAPVLGPAAAGPAVAGEATVLAAGAAVGGLAVGAWELPRDMLVQAHRGEMVVPAGVTPWAQGVISGAAGTPGVNTVHVHVTHAPVINAVDGDSVRRFYQGSEGKLLRQLNDAARRGAHIGLSKLGAT